MQRTTILAGAVAALATTLGAAPGAFAAKAVYGGSTNSGEAIVLTADGAGTKLKSAVLAWRAKCSDGTGLPYASSVTPTTASPGFSPGPRDLLMARNGKKRFSVTQLLGLGIGDSSAAVKVTVAGRLGRKAASGTMSVDVTIVDNASGDTKGTCGTGRMSWKASRAPGRVYGGSTSQDEPFVAKVDARRKRVTDVLVGWGSPCNPEGYFHFPEQLHNFSLASSGRFGDTWDEPIRLDDGGTRTFAYGLTGRLSRRAGSGTFQVAVTEKDAGGATTATCDTGRLTWKATTG